MIQNKDVLTELVNLYNNLDSEIKSYIEKNPNYNGLSLNSLFSSKGISNIDSYFLRINFKIKKIDSIENICKYFKKYKLESRQKNAIINKKEGIKIELADNKELLIVTLSPIPKEMELDKVSSLFNVKLKMIFNILKNKRFLLK